MFINFTKVPVLRICINLLQHDFFTISPFGNLIVTKRLLGTFRLRNIFDEPCKWLMPYIIHW